MAGDNRFCLKMGFAHVANEAAVIRLNTPDRATAEVALQALIEGMKGPGPFVVLSDETGGRVLVNVSLLAYALVV